MTQEDSNIDVAEHLRNVLQWEENRMGVVSAGVLKQAIGQINEDAIEHNAMVDTIEELMALQKELVAACRMALQQFEFTYGKRKRGWACAFLMERLSKAIERAQMSKADEAEGFI